VNRIAKLLVTILVVSVAGLGVACGGDPPLETTPDKIADSVAEFYSVVHDRSDITEGEFNLLPDGADTFVITANAELLRNVNQDSFVTVLTLSLATTKNLSDDGTRLTVDTNDPELEYELRQLELGPQLVRTVFLRLNEEDVPVEVRLVIRSIWGYNRIDEDAATQLLALNVNEPHEWRLRLDKDKLCELDERGRFCDRSLLTGESVADLGVVIAKILSNPEYWLDRDYRSQIESYFDELASNHAEYQALLAKSGSLSSEEQDRQGTLVTEIWNKAREFAQAEDPDLPRTGQELILTYTFVLPVIIESIDGINVD